MDIACNIHDFIVMGLPKEKRKEFLRDVNCAIKNIEEPAQLSNVSGQFPREEFVFHYDVDLRLLNEIQNFADKWYRDVPYRWTHANFVIKNLRSSKWLGNCISPDCDSFCGRCHAAKECNLS